MRTIHELVESEEFELCFSVFDRKIYFVNFDDRLAEYERLVLAYCVEDDLKKKGNHLKRSWGKYRSGEYFVRVEDIMERAKLFGRR